MRSIDLDAKGWREPLDFSNALLHATDAPEGHGNGIAALMEGLVWGGTGTIEPPYAIRISGLNGAPADVVEWVKLIQDRLQKAKREFKERNGHDVDVTMEIVS